MKSKKLPDAFMVLHAVKRFARTLGTVGEIDFLIAHPDYGVLLRRCEFRSTLCPDRTGLDKTNAPQVRSVGVVHRADRLTGTQSHGQRCVT